MILGAHVSIANGVENAVWQAESIGCETFQLFTKNQTQWKEKQFTSDEVLAFKTALNDSRQRSDCVAAHGSYLINLCSNEEAKLNKSRQAFLSEIKRCADLQIPFLIFHPGSHLGKGEEWAINVIAESLMQAIENSAEMEVKLLLETTAGQGSNLGYRPEQLSKIINMVNKPERLGVCLDTCHLYAAGYDLRPERYHQTMRHILDQVEHTMIYAFHLNDSKRDLGSKVDRHEIIGAGFLGEDTFKLLINDDRFSDIPGILEIPGGLESFEVSLKKLKGFRIP